MPDPYQQATQPTVKKPTADEFKKGPRVRLHRPGWTNYDWYPPGFAYAIKFDGDDKAEVVKDHYDLWIGDTNARVNGVVVTQVPVRKKTTKTKGA